MVTLCIDTSREYTSVCLSDGDKIIVEKNMLMSDATHSEYLMPLIDECLKEASMKVENIEKYAYSNGPGSFTGLRIALSTIKGLNLFNNKIIVPVSTLKALAYNALDASNENKFIVPIIDAKQSLFYYAIFKQENNSLVEIAPENFENISSILEIVENEINNMDFILIGDTENINLDTNVVTNSNKNKLILGSIYELSKNINEQLNLELNYIRLSQAERDRLKKLTENIN